MYCERMNIVTVFALVDGIELNALLLRIRISATQNWLMISDGQS